jgi:hypothetical protein
MYVTCWKQHGQVFYTAAGIYKNRPPKEYRCVGNIASSMYSGTHTYQENGTGKGQKKCINIDYQI